MTLRYGPESPKGIQVALVKEGALGLILSHAVRPPGGWTVGVTKGRGGAAVLRPGTEAADPRSATDLQYCRSFMKAVCGLVAADGHAVSRGFAGLNVGPHLLPNVVGNLVWLCANDVLKVRSATCEWRCAALRGAAEAGTPRGLARFFASCRRAS